MSESAVEPRASFWGWFTRTGRLVNRWARAWADEDRARGLERLRQVRRQMHDDPRAFAHLWLPFLETYLAADRVRDLTADDLADVSAMADTLGTVADAPVQPDEIWDRLA